MPQTILYVPPLWLNLVPRPQLIERLNQGLQQGCKLTLISAPAGFGKTTLVSVTCNVSNPYQLTRPSTHVDGND